MGAVPGETTPKFGNTIGWKWKGSGVEFSLPLIVTCSYRIFHSSDSSIKIMKLLL